MFWMGSQSLKYTSDTSAYCSLCDLENRRMQYTLVTPVVANS